jgi:hypothetical protein
LEDERKRAGEGGYEGVGWEQRMADATLQPCRTTPAMSMCCARNDRVSDRSLGQEKDLHSGLVEISSSPFLASVSIEKPVPCQQFTRASFRSEFIRFDHF